MRRFLLFLMLFLPLGLMAQVDDMYFVPKKKKAKEVETKDNEFVTTQERIQAAQLPQRDEDEYNRRPSAADSEYYDDEYSEEEEYQEAAADEETADYYYSSRIVRFHSPRRVIVSSPWYWDVVYTSDIDNWVLYDDGIYWELYPVYTPWYHASWSWSWGWPYYSWGHYDCWGHWHTPHHWWHGGYHGHYHPHFGGHFAGGGHYRDGRVPPITNMRGGTSIARGTSIERTGGARRGEFTQGGIAQSGNRGAVSTSRSRGSSRTGTSVERTGSVRRGDASRRTEGTTVDATRGQNRTNYRGVGGEQRPKRTAVRGGGNNREKTYDRPSSTRTTTRSSKVERSSSSSERSKSSRSSFSSGSSRSSFGSGSSSRSGGSRGGGGGASRSGGGSRGGRR